MLIKGKTPRETEDKFVELYFKHYDFLDPSCPENIKEAKGAFLLYKEVCRTNRQEAFVNRQETSYNLDIGRDLVSGVYGQLRSSSEKYGE